MPFRTCGKSTVLKLLEEIFAREVGESEEEGAEEVGAVAEGVWDDGDA
jgi:hypothetical protein